ncbi:hypothetical protein KV205_01240 [Streptomyces sp. SKN60]|uniref:hypothetical protein n=1 Tax=Streptomyces sp. SKN60 TaxID=2855506 RepID=UPI0022452529|nr:hypothetical protein [Streptomyces sp. SKN60]MCX2179159.1 hypothetical protein [Streptomyces sp. SKN60]
MTSAADTTQHPDVSEISDLTEGLLPPTRSAAVRQHLGGCPLCADVRDSLEEIRGLLGTLPGPPRMPAEIAGRIDAALAAEALLSATAPDTEARVSRETSPARTSPSAAAGGRPAGHPSATRGPGRPRTARRRRVAVLGTVFGVAALGLGVFFVQSTPDSTADRSVSAASASRFDGQPVATTVRTLLAPNGTFKAPQDQNAAPKSMSAESGGDAQHRALPSALPACVKAGTGRTEPVLAFRQGDYQGTPAYLVVLPDSADSTRVQAYVVDAGCASGGGNAPGEVLLKESVPRS